MKKLQDIFIMKSLEGIIAVLWNFGGKTINISYVIE